MLTNVTETSLDSFFDLKSGSKLQDQQAKIISVMQPGQTYTRRELAKLAGLETSSASARINSLLTTRIAVVGRKQDPITNRNVEELALL